MRLSKEERRKLSETVEGLDMLADEKERAAGPRGEMRRLTAFMKAGGALVAEDVPGVGRVYRSRARTCPPFGPETVERYCAKLGAPLPPLVQ